VVRTADDGGLAEAARRPPDPVEESSPSTPAIAIPQARSSAFFSRPARCWAAATASSTSTASARSTLSG